MSRQKPAKEFEFDMLHGFKSEHERIMMLVQEDKDNRFEKLYKQKYGRNGLSIDSKFKAMKWLSYKNKDKHKDKFVSQYITPVKSIVRKLGNNDLLVMSKSFQHNYNLDWIKDGSDNLMKTRIVEKVDDYSVPKIYNKAPVRKINNYAAFHKSLDFIEYENLLLKDKINKSKDDYKNISMKIDKRLMVNTKDL